MINNITGEGDYPLIPREHIQDNIEKSVEINDIKTPDNIEELLMNDLKILD